MAFVWLRLLFLQQSGWRDQLLFEALHLQVLRLDANLVCGLLAFRVVVLFTVDVGTFFGHHFGISSDKELIRGLGAIACTTCRREAERALRQERRLSRLVVVYGRRDM